MKFGCTKNGNCFAPLLCFLFFTAAVSLGALETSRDNIRLVLHENSGRFSLYGLNKDGRFEPFFSDIDPRTSFIELFADNRIYRLGDASAFRFHIDASEDSPAIVFESKTLELRQQFSFVKTAGSPETNGVKINIRLRNRGTDEVSVRARFLLDTSLGEASGGTPFFLNRQAVLAETLSGGAVDRPWVSRSASLALMGSIGGAPESGETNVNPDYLHFANWKRLSETSLKSAAGAAGNTGQNFNFPPYSFNDSAVCYYYAPRALSGYEEINYVVLLAAEDPAGFYAVPETAAAAGPDNISPSGDSGDASREADLFLLRGLVSRIDQHMEGLIELSEEELSTIEETITQLKARYNL